MKKTLFTLYIVVIAVMAIATIVEKNEGTAFVSQHIYGAWWFSALWALLTAAAIAWIVKQRMRRWALLLLHASFVVILIGAFLTHVSAQQGFIHLRIGETTDQYQLLTSNTQHPATNTRQLPFKIRLDNFHIIYYEGTDTPADYQSELTISPDAQHEEQSIISMNKILSRQSFRFYQSSYDDDQQGSTIAINSDPYGIPVTYLGYALLFFSLLYMLIDPKGTFRKLLRSPLLKTVLLAALLLPTNPLSALGASSQLQTASLPTIPREEANQFGRLFMLYNGRICPVQTFAIDFTKKLYGKNHYKEYSAEQVLLGFIFWQEQWNSESILKIKNGALKSQLDLPKYCTVNTFFNQAMGGYILGPYLQEYYHGNHDSFHKQALQIDEKIKLVMDLQTGLPLKLFPAPTVQHSPDTQHPAAITWLAPTGTMPDGMDSIQRKFITEAFNLLYQDALSGNLLHFGSIVSDISRYQQENAAQALPSIHRTKAERLYNRIPFATILFMLNLTMGFLILLGIIIPHVKFHIPHSASILAVLSFLALTFAIVLRWMAKGTIPISNGYETMLLTAWFVLLLSILTHYRLRHSSTLASLVLAFGFLVSGFFLLVSHISQMDPQITHMMPVLNSPLLTLHVSIIMLAYALLSLTFICAIIGILLKQQRDQLAVLSRIFLFPAITTLGLGIFIGALWANVSWGTYWSWDPKETWALITFMVYAIPLHVQSLPLFKRPLAYHVCIAIAFATLLITYFGVNYILGGMHSYA